MDFLMLNFASMLMQQEVEKAEKSYFFQKIYIKDIRSATVVIPT